MADPTSITQTQTTIPDYARDYVERLLGRAESQSLTPYQTYGGERTAQFTPLQQQSFAGAQNLGPASQLSTATQMASQAGQYQPGQFQGGIFGQEQAQQYMSPYMQSVVDIQQREAARRAGIAGTQQQSQATQAGAYGGGRDAIMRAEAARNLATQQGDIQAQGLQAAYTNAQQQFNADMSRGLQAQQLGEQSRQYGAGLGLQGAQALANIGGEQFRQQLGTYGLQNQFGGQQQQQIQNVLNQNYQDYLTQRQYPYQQYAFMSDMLRGMPLSQSSSQMFQAPPSPLSQVAGAGLTAYGLTRASGGSIPSGAGLADLAISRMR